VQTMSANIYRYELHVRLKSVLIWSAALAFLILFFLSLFPAFAGQAALMDEMLARFPAEMRAAFNLDKMDLATLLGYFSFTFLFVQLCMAIQASNYGFGLLSIEEAELTADFLLSKPVSRIQVLTSKLLAAVTGLVLTNLVVWVSSFLAISLFKGEREYELQTLLLLLFSGIIFQLFFLSVGMVISLLVRRVRNVTPYGLGLGFGAYLLSAFSGVIKDIVLELLTPFKQFDVTYIVAHGAYDMPLVWLNVGNTVVALAASYWLYLHRDIPAVS